MCVPIDIFINMAIIGGIDIYRILLSVPLFVRWLNNLNNKKWLIDQYVKKTSFTGGGTIYTIGSPIMIRNTHKERYVETSFANNYFTNLHRSNGPAVEFDDGSREEWYMFGKLHRLDGGPSFICNNAECKEWIKFDRSTRNGLTARFIINIMHMNIWMHCNEQSHKKNKYLMSMLTDGGLKLTNGLKLWYKNGQLFHISGNAIYKGMI